MLCGIKWWAFVSKKNAYRIIELAGLNVTKNYNTKREVLINGEPKTSTKYGKYKCWHIVVKKETNNYRLEVRGSLHKFFHGNNKGSFTGMEVLAALQGMYDLFNVEPLEVNVQNIEVGINLPVWFFVYPYLTDNLLFHKKRAGEHGDLKGIGYVFQHDDYLIKLYAKGEQLLRYEIRYTSQEKLRSFGIQTGEDLHESNINKLAESLVSEWPEVIMKDDVDFFNEKNNINGLSKKQLTNLYKFTSIGYQQSYKKQVREARKKGDKKRCEALRRKAHRLQNLFMKIIKGNGDETHEKLSAIITDGVAKFKNTWKENVTISPFDKVEENGTYI